MNQMQTHPSTPVEDRVKLLRLVVTVLLVVSVAAATGAAPALAVVGAVILLIMLHELGHFATAKWADMKVTEFFLGFGPRLWSIRRGETEYGVKAIPAGGYVKIVGMSNLEQVDPADEPRTYRQKSYPRRLSVAIAGSTVHFVLAFLLLYVTLAVLGVPAEQPRIGSVTSLESGPSPAEQAGFQVGDTLVSYDGRRFDGWEELRRYIRARPGQRIDFEVERDGRRLTLTATPADLSTIRLEDERAPLPPAPRAGFVGIGPAFEIERAGPVAALGRSTAGIAQATVDTVRALGTLVSPSGVSSYASQLSGRPGPTEPDPNAPRFVSPVGLARLAGQAAESGLRTVFVLLFSINVFVGVFNMIPLLPFDGGHVAIATYERIRSRRGRPYRADVAKWLPVSYAVVVLLVVIGITSIYIDIARPLANPFQ